MPEDRFHIEGDYLRLINPNTGEHEYVVVVAREMATLEYTWNAHISSGAENGPEEIDDIEPAEDRRELYQGIYGIREDVYIYKDLPSNVRLGGFTTIPKALSTNRGVGFVDNRISPYDNPDFDTEFFLRGNTNLSKINLTAYNNSGVTVRPRIFFMVNKMLIATVTEQQTLAKLRTGEIKARPVTLGGLPSTRGEILRG